MMRRVKTYIKKFSTNLKRAWRRLKYLDKTQLNYYIVTSFIGIFCLFTGTTYSAFTISKYLNAATITIAKLNYTLASTSSSYSSGVVSLGAGETAMVDLTLTSLNAIETKYALNYSTSGNVKVYYSQNIKNNMSGTIGTNGSAITMRVVAVNSGSSSATVNLSVSGGYVKNSLSTNITEGYFESDIVLRTILLDENFNNGTQSATFPEKTSEYAYYRTVCTSPVDVTWSYDDWTVSLSNLTEQVACDAYFKKMTSDIEIYFLLNDSTGQNGTLAESVPNDGTYTFKSASCSTNATATWDSTNWQLMVSNIGERTLCVAEFNHT